MRLHLDQPDPLLRKSRKHLQVERSERPTLGQALRTSSEEFLLFPSAFDSYLPQIIIFSGYLSSWSDLSRVVFILCIHLLWNTRTIFYQGLRNYKEMTSGFPPSLKYNLKFIIFSLWYLKLFQSSQETSQ